MSAKPIKGQPGGQSALPVFAAVVGVLVLVVIVAAVAIVVTRGDDDEATDVGGSTENTDVTDGATIDTGGPPETVPPGQLAFADVEVQGDELPELPEGGDDPAAGQPAPTLVGQDPSGEAVTIAPGDGPLVVVFLAHWCPHCQAEVPRIVDLAAEGDEGDTIEGVPFAAVLTASDPTLENFPPGEWLAREGWPAPALLDNQPESGFIPDAFRAYGVSGYPFLVAIDGDGNVVERRSGEQSPEELRDFFAQVAE